MSKPGRIKMRPTGFSPSQNAEVTEEEGVEAVTGMSREKAILRMKAEKAAKSEIPHHLSSKKKSMLAGTAQFRTVYFPIMYHFTMKALSELGGPNDSGKVDHIQIPLRAYFGRGLEVEEAMAKTDRSIVPGLLQGMRKMTSVVGSIHVSGLSNTSWMSFIGRFQVKGLAAEMHLPYNKPFEEEVHKFQGNLLFPRATVGTERHCLRSVSGKIRSSSLAEMGGFTMHELESVQMDSTGRKRIVPRNNPICKMINEEIRCDVCMSLGVDRNIANASEIADPTTRREFVKHFRALRIHVFGVEDIQSEGSDLLIDNQVYEKHLRFLREDEEQHCTLAQFLQGSVILKRLYRNVDPFTLYTPSLDTMVNDVEFLSEFARREQNKKSTSIMNKEPHMIEFTLEVQLGEVEMD